MHGITLKRLGCDVQILEQNTSNDRESQAAGIGISPKVTELLERNAIPLEGIGFPSAGIHIIGHDLSRIGGFPYQMSLTAWTVLYHRLRAYYDGFTSTKCPQVVPTSHFSPGTAIYDLGKRVTSVQPITDGQGIQVTYDSLLDKSTNSIIADLVLAADGGNSLIRQYLAPEVTRPYSGYVAWRGCVPESIVSQPTRDLLLGIMTYHPTPSHGYLVTYVIPSDSGSTAPGSRLFNILWYFPCPEDSSSYIEAMTDIHGHRHAYTVPPGRVREQVWRRQCELGTQVLPEPYAELLSNIDQPFITAISDTISPQAVYLEGRLLLVGDALALHRPHTGMSTSLAAAQATLLEKVMSDEMSLVEWERLVLQSAKENRVKSMETARLYMGIAFPDNEMS